MPIAGFVSSGVMSGTLPEAAAAAPSPAAVAASDADTASCILLSDLPPTCGEPQLLELLRTIGEPQHLSLADGCAFFSLACSDGSGATPATLADTCIQRLHGVPILGHELKAARVGKIADLPPSLLERIARGASVAAGVSSIPSSGTLSVTPTVLPAAAAPTLLPSLPLDPVPALTTLVLIGIVQRDELGDAERLEVVRTHVMDECKELGELLEVSKPKEHHRTKRNRALKHEREALKTPPDKDFSPMSTLGHVSAYIYISPPILSRCACPRRVRRALAAHLRTSRSARMRCVHAELSTIDGEFHLAGFFRGGVGSAHGDSHISFIAFSFWCGG